MNRAARTTAGTALLVALLTGCSGEPVLLTRQQVPSEPITQEVCRVIDLPRAAAALRLHQRSSTRGASSKGHDARYGPTSTVSCSASWTADRTSRGGDVTLIGDRYVGRAEAQRRWDFVADQALHPFVVGGEVAAERVSARPPEGDHDAAASVAGVTVVPASGSISGRLVDQTYLRHWVLAGDTIYTVIMTHWTPAVGVDRDETLAAMQAAADEVVSRAT